MSDYQIGNLPTMTWLIKAPDHLIQNVLLTKKASDGNKYVEFGCIDEERVSGGGEPLAYMIIPSFYEEQSAWKSEYKEDDLPSESGQFISFEECKYNPRLNIKKTWFDKRTRKFSGIEALAFMDVPKPYNGIRTLVFQI